MLSLQPALLLSCFLCEPLAAARGLRGWPWAGKSTLLRAACSAVILAQMGCPVPAASATLSLTDRIFTRLGAPAALLLCAGSHASLGV